MIPTQILRVLSTIRRHDVRALLMGGQACVLYGAAEYSRDLDLAVLATPEALPRLRAAMTELSAEVIAVPAFEVTYLARGHAVHFAVPTEMAPPLRVDIMARMRGVADFPELWARRTTIELPSEGDGTVSVDLLALEDLVAAKKTQRDKDWPMLRRLVDASYVAEAGGEVTTAQIDFWLAELRTPDFLIDAIIRFPVAAARSTRPAVIAARSSGDVDVALLEEQEHERAADREWWAPLRRELEQLRFEARRLS